MRPTHVTNREKPEFDLDARISDMAEEEDYQIRIEMTQQLLRDFLEAVKPEAASKANEPAIDPRDDIKEPMDYYFGYNRYLSDLEANARKAGL